jgi:hypothetical protein
MKEKELCVSLGISREQIKELREKFPEGENWNRIKSRKPQKLWEVEWTEQGVQNLFDSIGVKKEETPKPPEEKRGTISAKHKNPRLLTVLIDGKTSTVLCRDSSKFGIGMSVDVRWDGGRWVVVRHPRFVGKY